jgi:hypothetical protein
MARSTGQGGARSVMKAAERLDEINREVAEILRVFPDLRTLGGRHGARVLIARVTRSDHYDFARAGRIGRTLLH